MRRIARLTMCLLLAVVAVGCSAYNPVCVDIPLIQKKGDIQIEGAVVPFAVGYHDYIGARGSLAVGISDHSAVAVCADPMRKHYQVMGGYYSPVGRSFVWETYMGGAYGGRSYLSGGAKNYTNWMMFVQGDAGWHNLTRFLNLDIAVSLKAGYMYRDLNIRRTVGVMGTRSDIQSFYSYYDNVIEHCLLVEPTFEVRFGWPDFKFNVRVGYAHLFGTKEGWYFPYSIGAGMSYRFNARR